MVEITTIQGVDSLAASRITINDNFASIQSALDDVLQIVNISTGKINNSGYGSDNDLETEDLIINGSTGGGINVVSGNISMAAGDLKIIGGNFRIELGNNIKIQKYSKNLSVGTIDVLSLSGVGVTGGSGPVGYVSLPRLNTATINDIQQPELGALVFDIDLLQVVVCTASGTTGTWTSL